MITGLLPKGRTIYFNEELHKYTDDMDNVYTSTTTLIKKYEPEKDFEGIAAACERIGKNPRHPKYEKYKGKTKRQILKSWDKIADEGKEKGTIKHNFLEISIKQSSGYTLNAKGFINDKLYTVDDIIKKHNYGLLNLEFFSSRGVHTRYPKIYACIKAFVEAGYRIYAEIGVYDGDYLISGLVDILLVNGEDFVILDWKTNKDEIRFESGYFEKDNNGVSTNRFIATNDMFNYPLNHLPASTGNGYTLQLSTYAYLVETFGYKCKGIILCHIRDILNSSEELVTLLPIRYLKSDVKKMILYDYNKRSLKQQKRIRLN
jgi:hypothetical protein